MNKKSIKNFLVGIMYVRHFNVLTMGQKWKQMPHNNALYGVLNQSSVFYIFQSKDKVENGSSILFLE